MPDKIKLCVECKHYRQDEMNKNFYDEASHVCRHSRNTSVVHGKMDMFSCAVTRMFEDRCGYAGQWFEPREKAKEEGEV